MSTKITLNDLVANPDLLRGQPGEHHCLCADGEFDPMCPCQDRRYEELGREIEARPVVGRNLAR